MRITWSYVSIKDHTWKLWRSEVAGGFKPQRLRENVYLAPTLGRKTNGFLMVGKGPLQKF
jgi:hypothetical protein